MNPSILLLRALKGTCALNCLAALHLAGPLPVSQGTIMDLTGYDDGAVNRGLHTLLVLGLATSTGRDHHTAWQLAPAAACLPHPFNLFLASPENRESDPLFKEEEEQEETNITNRSLLDSSSAVIPARPVARVSTPISPHKTLESSSLRGGRFSYGRTERVLRRHFYAVFDAANVYLQFRRPLADALLAEDRAASPADGPGWLCQALGWLCYAQRRLPHVQRGAVVYISLRDRLPCDPAYLPPPDLPFEAALAWALRGGQDEPEPDDGQTLSQTLRVSETLRVSSGPEDQLWRAVLDRLSHELPPAVLDAHLRPARLISLEVDRCRLAVPTPQSRDWLAARLAAVLACALREVAGRALAIEILVDT